MQRKPAALQDDMWTGLPSGLQSPVSTAKQALIYPEWGIRVTRLLGPERCVHSLQN